MDFWTDEQIKGKMLHKLTRKGKFEHSHTDINNLQAGFPPELRGRAARIAEELIKERVLYLKKTNYGKHVSINLGMKDRIISYIDEFLEKE
jgi:hypothetical protein